MRGDIQSEDELFDDYKDAFISTNFWIVEGGAAIFNEQSASLDVVVRFYNGKEEKEMQKVWQRYYSTSRKQQDV